jgi:glycosyltransferase involved in cell wall biosynthesis
MARKKILILGKLPPPYMGPSIATEIILRSALREKFELIHLDTRINRSLEGFGKWSLGKIFRNLSLYRQMNSLLRTHRPDLVLIPISQTSTGFLKDSVFIRLASLHRRKILLQLRGSDFKNWIDNANGLIRGIVSRALGKTDGMIVLGNKLRYLFADYYRPEQIFVVPNGGNYTFPHALPHNEVRILFFSNLLAAKGVEDVLLAVKMLQTTKKFSIDLVGEWYEPSERERCLKIVGQTEAKVRIHSPKAGAEKFRFLADADIFVFPPREPEGHPWAIVEAMAAGLPIISTDKGAITESVIDQKNGFIVEPSQPAQLAAKLKLLIEDDLLRESMGNESRNLYLLNFTEEKMIERLEKVFNEVIGA